MNMDIGHCCFGCGPAYFEAAWPFVVLVGIAVAARCAWLTRHAPHAPLYRVWGPWLAVPTAFLLFLDRGSIGYDFGLHPATSVLAAMVQVATALLVVTMPILSFVAPLAWLARRHPEWSGPQRFVGAATASEAIWRGAALALLPFA